MHNLTANFINETQKLVAKKRMLVFLLLLFFLPLAVAALVSMISGGNSILSLSVFQNLLLGFLTGIVLPLQVFQLTGDLFAGELGDKSIKTVLLRPISRFKVFASKQLAILLLVAISLLIAWLATLVCGLLWMGGAVFGSGLWAGFSSYAVSLLPLAALVTLGTLIAQFFRSGSGALVFCILLFIACKLVVFIIPSLSTYLITSYTDWYTWVGTALTAGKTTSACLFLLASSIISFTAGYVLFDRKEI
ncbi:MAG: rane spanning protein [Bacilli bacterium]|nr:rane spanning protein [Bacilli bacterium]